MFKKRGKVQKKVDMQQQAEQIQAKTEPQGQSQPQQPQQPSQDNSTHHNFNPSLPRSKVKTNIFTIQTMEIENTRQAPLNQRQQSTLEQDEMMEYLKQIKNIRPLEVISEENQQTNQKITENMPVQPQFQQNYEESQDHYLLEVQEDLNGGLSPEREDNPFMEDYEDQLIRKTLTKHNYEKVQLRGGTNLMDLKAIESQDKLLEKVQKISAKRIENTIKRDIQQKMNKYDILVQDMKAKQKSKEHQTRQLQRKQRRLKEVTTEFQKINKVIEYIYYHGDKIDNFEVGAILRQIDNQNRIKQQQYNYQEVS